MDREPSHFEREPVASLLRRMSREMTVHRIASARGGAVCLLAAALAIAAPSGAAQEVPAPLQGLAGDDAQARLAARTALAARGAEALADLECGLDPALPDTVRAGCVAVLRTLCKAATADAGREPILDLLARALDDPWRTVSLDAAVGLAEAGDGRGLAVLLRAQSAENPLECWEATRALRALGQSQVEFPRETVPLLIENLRRPDRRLREETLRALLSLTGQSFGFLLGSPREHFPARDAIQMIHAEAEAEKQEIETHYEQEVFPTCFTSETATATEKRQRAEADKRAELAAVGTESVERIRHLRAEQIGGHEEEWRASLMRWKRWWQRNQSHGRLRWLLDGLQHNDAVLRAATVETLGRLGAPETIDALGRALADPEAPVRERAAWALGQFADTRVVGLLVNAMEENHAAGQTRPEFALVVQEIGRSLRALTGADYPTYPRYWTQWWGRVQRHAPSEGAPERPFVVGDSTYVVDVRTDSIYAISIAQGASPAAGGPIPFEVRRWIPSENRWFCHRWTVAPGGKIAATGLRFEPVDNQGYRALFEMEFDTGLVFCEAIAAGRLVSRHPREEVPSVRATLAPASDSGAAVHVWAPR